VEFNNSSNATTEFTVTTSYRARDFGLGHV
jgi:hypothetical protein